ncbi:putative LRR receptor-like serine/threonine-protein kinase, partial [Mucuna pruriens]
MQKAKGHTRIPRVQPQEPYLFSLRAPTHRKRLERKALPNNTTLSFIIRYYGLGMENGFYNITLQFAEIAIMDKVTWKSLGRRVFDIYIQVCYPKELEAFVGPKQNGPSNVMLRILFKWEVPSFLFVNARIYTRWPRGHTRVWGPGRSSRMVQFVVVCVRSPGRFADRYAAPQALSVGQKHNFSSKHVATRDRCP